jgi:Subtilase family
MGGSKQVSRLFAAVLSGACGLFLTATPRNTGAAEEWRARVSDKLQSIYDARPAAAVGTAAANMARFDGLGRVEADVYYNCSSGAPAAAVAAAGLSASGGTHLPPLCVVEGWIAPSALPTLAAVAGVTRVKLPSYASHIPHPSLKSTAASQAAGTIDGNALTIMHADQFVAQAGGGGGGVLVGVQSQGVASLSTIQGRHELPDVKVLTSAAGASNSPFADEGTALLQEVHAVAPNAGLAFCEPQTFVQYTACLQQFVKAGSTVMVDDILFPDQDPMSSGGTDVQAIEQFLTQNPNVALFTAAGNANGSYWEGSYTPVSVASQGLSPLSCPGKPQVDNFVNQFAGGANQILTITPSGAISVPVTFAWADPPGQNASNFDVYWTNVTDSTKSGCLSTAASTDDVITQSIALYPGTNIVYVATPDASLAGKFLKLFVGGDGLTALSLSTAGSFVTPQAFAPGVISVGAVNGSDGLGNKIEHFSSLGPITVAFPSPAKIQAPVLVAPDGIYVDSAGTYFSSVVFPDGNFYGTSASAPNAAAVAALIRGAFPNLTVAQLLSALQTGATQLGASAPDGTFGYGRIDAMGALGTLPVPTITSLPDTSIDASSSTTSAALSFTVSGTGSLHFSVASTNSTLIPASMAGAGAPGVAISPSDCGTKTLTCSLKITAAQYQGGTATVTVSAVDGAGRSAPATVHVTVSNPQTAPPSPPTSTTTTSSGGGHGGGSLSLWEILVAAALALSRAISAAAGQRRDLRVIR